MAIHFLIQGVCIDAGIVSNVSVPRKDPITGTQMYTLGQEHTGTYCEHSLQCVQGKFFFSKLSCHVTWYCQTRLQHEFEIFEYAASARMQACRKLDILDSVAICYISLGNKTSQHMK